MADESDLDTLPNFSPEESTLIKEAWDAGTLSEEEQTLIMDRVSGGDIEQVSEVVAPEVEPRPISETFPELHKGTLESAVGVAENVGSMMAVFGADIAGGITTIAEVTANELLRKPAAYLDNKFPLGGITYGDEGVKYDPTVTAQENIRTATQISEMAQAIRNATMETIHPFSETGKEYQQYLGETLGEFMHEKSAEWEKGLTEFFNEQDILSPELEGAMVGLAKAGPEVIATALPIPISKAVGVVTKGRKAKAQAKNEFTEQAANVIEDSNLVEYADVAAPFTEFQAAYKLAHPKSSFGEIHNKFSEMVEGANLERQKARTQAEGITPELELEPLGAQRPVRPEGQPISETLDVIRDDVHPVRQRAQEAHVAEQVLKQEIDNISKLDPKQFPESVDQFVKKSAEVDKLRKAREFKAGKQPLIEANKVLNQVKNDIREKTAPVFEEIERVETKKQAYEETFEFNQKAAYEEAVALEDAAIDKVPRLARMYRSQRGSVDMSVFIDGIFEVTDGIKAFTDRLVQEKGEAYRPLAPALYEAAKQQRPEQPKAVVKPYQEQAKMHHMLHNVWAVTGGRAVQRIARFGEAAPSLLELANRIEHSVKAVRPITKDFSEAVGLATGKFHTRLDDILKPALKTVRAPFTGKHRTPVLHNILGKLRENDFTGPLGETVRDFRSLLNDIYKYAEQGGVEVRKLENFFPRLYDWKAIKKNPQGFITALQKAGIEPGAAQTIMQKIVHERGLLDISDLSISNLSNKISKVTKKTSSLELDRVLKIPDKAIQDFLNNNVTDVMSKYIDNVTNRVEYARRFGNKNQELKALLEKGKQELKESGLPLERSHLDQLDLDVAGLALAVQRAYKPITSTGWRKANSAALSAGYVLTLPLATLSSLVEPIIMLSYSPLRTGPALMKGMGNAVRESARSVFPKIPASDMTRFAEASGRALDIGVSERMSAMFAGDMNVVNNLFFKTNMLHQWTRTVNIMSQDLGRSMIKGYLQDVTKGTASKRKQRILTELGIDFKKGKEWIESGARESHPFFEEQVRTGALRFNNQVVMMPRAAVKPLWMSDPHFALVAQLKGFPVTFGNTVMRKWYESSIGELRKGNLGSGMQGAAANAGTMMTMVTAAWYINELRDKIMYGNRPPKRENSEKLTRAVERIGAPGILQAGIDAATAEKWGNGFFDPLLGPIPSKAGQIISATAMGNPTEMARQITKAIPGTAFLPKSVQKSIQKDIKKTITEPAVKGVKRGIIKPIKKALD